MVNSISFMFDEKAKKLNFDKTKTGVITRVIGDNLCDVSVDGHNYKNVATKYFQYEVNDIVDVMIPQNNYSNMCVVAKKSGEADLKINKETEFYKDVKFHETIELTNKGKITILSGVNGNEKIQNYSTWGQTQLLGTSIIYYDKDTCVINDLGDFRYEQNPDGTFVEPRQKIDNGLVAKLTNLGITKVDAIIISHYHGDHIGGLEWLLASDIDTTNCTVYLPHNSLDKSKMIGQSYRSMNEKYVKDLIQNYNLASVYPEENDSVQYGRFKLTFNNLNSIYFDKYYDYLFDTYQNAKPSTDQSGSYIKGATNYNSFSMTTLVEYDNYKFFYSSDITFPVMENIYNLLKNVDIATSPHHSLEYKISQKYLSTLQPKYYVTNNGGTFYETIDLLKQDVVKYNSNTTYLNNNKCGDITFSLGTDIEVETEFAENEELCAGEISNASFGGFYPLTNLNEFYSLGSWEVDSSSETSKILNYPPKLPKRACRIEVTQLFPSGWIEQKVKVFNPEATATRIAKYEWQGDKFTTIREWSYQFNSFYISDNITNTDFEKYGLNVLVNSGRKCTYQAENGVLTLSLNFTTNAEILTNAVIYQVFIGTTLSSTSGIVLCEKVDGTQEVLEVYAVNEDNGYLFYTIPKGVPNGAKIIGNITHAVYPNQNLSETDIPKITKAEANGLELDIEWEAVKGATSYRVAIYNYTLGKYQYYNTSETTKKIDTSVGGVKYKVRLKAIKGSTQYPYSSDLTAPTITTT